MAAMTDGAAITLELAAAAFVASKDFEVMPAQEKATRIEALFTLHRMACVRDVSITRNDG